MQTYRPQLKYVLLSNTELLAFELERKRDHDNLVAQINTMQGNNVLANGKMIFRNLAETCFHVCYFWKHM